MATQALPRERGKQRSRLRVVEGGKKAARRRPSPLPIVILVVLAVFGVAALQAWVGQDGLRAAELEQDVQREYERLTLLRAQVAQLSSPQRLREEAAKLGLVPATDPVYLRVTVPRGSAEAQLPGVTAGALESSSP
ncbi:MAG: hypothetical protein ACRDKJ_13265 [Actinomycetota bacterium]